MLWHKTWIESRWRFLIGLALLTCSAAGIVIAYPRVAELLPLVPAIDKGGMIGQKIRESADLVRTYKGYVWSQWFSSNMPQMWILFAALLGSGGLLPVGAGNGSLFMLSMPVTRGRLMSVRVSSGMAELAVLALVPSLLICIFSPAIGERYAPLNAVVHSACLFIAGSVFFSLALLLSTIFADLWRPLLITLFVAAIVSGSEMLLPLFSPYGIFQAMTGESYFRTGALPWEGLSVSVLITIAFMYSATTNFKQRDF